MLGAVFRTRHRLLALVVACQLVHLRADCPAPCVCDATTISCTHRHLAAVPPGLPRVTTTLDMSHNSLGPSLKPLPSHLAHLETLDLADNGLVTLHGCVLAGIDSLQNLSLRDNHITELPGTLFSNQLQLKTFDISRNKLTTLLVTLFSMTEKLERLDLSYNLISDIPNAALQNLNKLKYIDLSHNKIKNLYLGSHFKSLVKLQLLDFSYNNLSNITGDAFSQANKWDDTPRTLRLSHCRISHIDPEAFGSKSIPNLKELDLSHNVLTDNKTLDNVMKKLNASQPILRRLILAGMQITGMSFLDQVHKLGLNYLNLSQNLLATIRERDLESFSDLHSLDLSHNRLTNVSAALKPLKHLRHLHLSHNHLDSLHLESNPQNLSRLDLSDNRLNGENFNLSLLGNLQYLDVSNNEMTSLMLPDNIGNLKHIDYRNNAINSFKSLNNCSSLEHFYLSMNNITELPDEMFKGATQKLKIIDLSNNHIHQLNSSIFKSLSAQYLDLSHNFISEIRAMAWTKTITLLLNNNQIEKIDVYAFHSMKSLVTLDLSYNKLIDLNKLVLDHTISLEHLNLSNNALATGQWQLVFARLGNLTDLNLGNNDIDSVEEKMFQPLKSLKSLSLNNNKISVFFPIAVRDLPLDNLDLSNNPWSCTCDLLAFRDWILRNDTPIPDKNSSGYKCQSPSGRRGQLVSDWQEGLLECDDSLLYLVIFASAGGFLLVAGIAAAISHRLYLGFHEHKSKLERLKILEGERMGLSEKMSKWRKGSQDSVMVASKEIAREIREALDRKRQLHKLARQEMIREDDENERKKSYRNSRVLLDNKEIEEIVRKTRSKSKNLQEENDYVKTPNRAPIEKRKKEEMNADERKSRNRRRSDYANVAPDAIERERRRSRSDYLRGRESPPPRPARPARPVRSVDSYQRYYHSNRIPTAAAPFVIAPAQFPLQYVDPRSGWGRDRRVSWEVENYFTMPSRRGDAHLQYGQRPSLTRPAEVRFSRKSLAEEEDRDGRRAYVREEREGRERSRSQSSLGPGRRREVQRQYEQIERMPERRRRSSSQPYLAADASSGWL